MENEDITCHLIEAINRIRRTRKGLKHNFDANLDLLKAEECIYCFATCIAKRNERNVVNEISN